MVFYKIAFLFPCILFFHGGQADGNHHNTAHQSWTKNDFLHKAKIIIRLANDSEHWEQIKRFNEKIYQMYSPVKRFVKEEIGLNLKDNKTHDIIKEQRTEDGPMLLDMILRILDSVEKDRSMNSTCFKDIAELLKGILIGAPWASDFFDAIGKPGPSINHRLIKLVGSYDECRAAIRPATDTTGQAGFHGNYCNFHIERLLFEQGLCFPSTCSSSEVTFVMRKIVTDIFQIPLGVHAECLTAPTEVTTATVFAILIVSSFGFFVIIGTIYEVITRNQRNSLTQNVIESENLSGNSNPKTPGSYSERSQYNETSHLVPSASPSKPTAVESNGILAKVLLAFSIFSNCRKLLNVSQSPGSLGTVHGIRCLSMSWVILCHVYFFSLEYIVNLPDALVDRLKRWTMLPVMNGFVAVDSFFTLSGLLISYLTIQEMTKKKTWKINWAMFYLHRFWRLTPPFMLVIVFSLGLGQYAGEGPLWLNEQPKDRMGCEKNWMYNLLYINNLMGRDPACAGHTWYLANDMQFFIISPLLVIPFYLQRLAGIASCLLLLLIHMITTGVLSTRHDWPTNPFAALQGKRGWLEDYYIVPWCRIGPFVVGTMAGYILALTKGGKFRMPRWIVILGWILSVSFGLLVVYGLHGDLTGDNPSTTEEAAFYNAVSRSVWGLCVSWVIIACSAGYGGFVNTLLSWTPFVFLGRLTYMCYLIHPYIIYMVLQNRASLIYMNETTMVIMYLGFLFAANIVAMFCVLVFESPLASLEKAFLRK